MSYGKSRSKCFPDPFHMAEQADGYKLMYATAGEAITADDNVTFGPNYLYQDDFQSYADTSALVAVWVESNTGTTDGAVTTTAAQFGYGTQGMRITSTSGNDDETLIDTVTAMDVTDHTMYIVAASSVKSGDYTVELGDGTNTGAAALVFAATGTFELLSFACNTTIFPKTGGTDVTITAVTKVGFMVVDSTANATLDVSLITILPATPAVRVYQADVDANSSMPVVGWCPEAIASAAKGRVRCRFSTKIGGQTSLLPGLWCYASATAGGDVVHLFNEATGTRRQFVGIAISTTEYVSAEVSGEI